MPVPLTTAALVMGFLFAAMGFDIPAIIVGSAGVLNQSLVEFAAQRGDDDGLG